MTSGFSVQEQNGVFKFSVVGTDRLCVPLKNEYHDEKVHFEDLFGFPFMGWLWLELGFRLVLVEPGAAALVFVLVDLRLLDFLVLLVGDREWILCLLCVFVCSDPGSSPA